MPEQKRDVEARERPLRSEQFSNRDDRYWPAASRKVRYLAARAVVQIGEFNTAGSGCFPQSTVMTLTAGGERPESSNEITLW
jgi:hypothetical protein